MAVTLQPEAGVTKHGIGILSGTPLLHWQLGARAEVSLPTLPATHWPPLRPLACSYSSLLSLSLWEQMDSVGLGCRPQTSSGTLEHVRGVSSSILQASQQGPLPAWSCFPSSSAFRCEHFPTCTCGCSCPFSFFPFSWGPHLVLSWSSTPSLSS